MLVVDVNVVLSVHIVVKINVVVEVGAVINVVIVRTSGARCCGTLAVLATTRAASTLLGTGAHCRVGERLGAVT
jgi:hypothetical protein